MRARADNRRPTSRRQAAARPRVSGARRASEMRGSEAIVDRRPETTALDQLRAAAENGPRAVAQRQLQATADASRVAAEFRAHTAPMDGTAQAQFEEEELLQGRARDADGLAIRGEGAAALDPPAGDPAPVQGEFGSAAPPSNSTGLPDGLKAGVESLSGVSMDDVNVRYNSAEPAQVNAHAYAQGTDIHLGPGQQRHLPHEAWHVAQQKQGRVRPTTQHAGVAINDDERLEREADVMGAAALRVSVPAGGEEQAASRMGRDPVQRVGDAGLIPNLPLRINPKQVDDAVFPEEIGGELSIGDVSFRAVEGIGNMRVAVATGVVEYSPQFVKTVSRTALYAIILHELAHVHHGHGWAALPTHDVADLQADMTAAVSAFHHNLAGDGVTPVLAMAEDLASKPDAVARRRGARMRALIEYISSNATVRVDVMGQSLDRPAYGTLEDYLRTVGVDPDPHVHVRVAAAATVPNATYQHLESVLQTASASAWIRLTHAPLTDGNNTWIAVDSKPELPLREFRDLQPLLEQAMAPDEHYAIQLTRDLTYEQWRARLTATLNAMAELISDVKFTLGWARPPLDLARECSGSLP